MNLPAWVAWLTRATFALAALSSWGLVRLAPQHARVAWVLTGALVLDTLRPVCKTAHLPVEVDRAMLLAFTALSLGLSLDVLARKSWLKGVRSSSVWAFVVALWLLGVGLVTHAGWPRGAPAMLIAAQGVQVGAALVSAAAVGGIVYRFGRWSVTESVVGLLVAGDISTLIGAWAHPEPSRAWGISNLQWVVVYGTVTFVHVWRLRWVTARLSTVARSSSPWGPLARS